MPGDHLEPVTNGGLFAPDQASKAITELIQNYPRPLTTEEVAGESRVISVMTYQTLAMTVVSRYSPQPVQRASTPLKLHSVMIRSTIETFSRRRSIPTNGTSARWWEAQHLIEQPNFCLAAIHHE